MGFHLFAGSVSVTHQYAHVSAYGTAVELGGLTISPGDLIHGDRHGVQCIPFSIAEDVTEKSAWRRLPAEYRLRETRLYLSGRSFRID